MYATRPGHDDRRYPITVAKYGEVRDVAQLTVGVPSRIGLKIAPGCIRRISVRRRASSRN